MINPRVSLLKKSTTLKITALTKKLLKEGKDVVNFAAGEPDFDTPEFIKTAAKEAIDRGFTKYTPSTGIQELKEAVAAKLQEENNLIYSKDNIIITTGAKYALFVALFGLLDFGDEVIIPSPYWVSYPEMVKLIGANTVFLPTLQTDNFKINPKELEKVITAKTKILILNYPNNPTGVTYSKQELFHIYEVVKDKGIFVVSDEIYEVLTYDNKKHVSFASLGGAKDFTITVNGFSKTFSMTGWRMGYLAAPSDIINEISKIIDHTTSCACSISQQAALAALRDKNWKDNVRAKFQERRDLLLSGLSGCDKLRALKPEGTFYMFCDVSRTGLSSFDFSTKLLERELVSCIPADAFGKEGFVRLSFSTDTQQISKGVKRIKRFINNG
ncbi:MAG: pyridoxal phosphate-dependent aminotransferase [Omnitrophica bacterium]|nr:pyridoxal phosphate-dependent aminotransferase [Candidatus Omnitrophota bacterium]